METKAKIEMGKEWEGKILSCAICMYYLASCEKECKSLGEATADLS